MSNFPIIALQWSLTMIAVLFGVFGFLYSAYANYTLKATPQQPLRANIALWLITVCKFLSLFILLNVLVATGLFIFIGLSVGWYILFGLGVFLTLLAIAIFSLFWAFRAMH
ncbi:MAG TPA: hypothetical protein VEP90_27715 [Methylomirabilota bacterium]|nr:hypothetical protein [Methylomirabilota bacterium]